MLEFYVDQFKQRKRDRKLLDKSEWFVRDAKTEICWECGQNLLVAKIAMKLN